MISCFNPWSLKDPDSARPQPEIQIRTNHIKTKHTERAKDILLYPWSLKTQIQPDSRNPDADWPNTPQSLTHSNIQTQTNRNNSRSSTTSTTRQIPGAAPKYNQESTRSTEPDKQTAKPDTQSSHRHQTQTNSKSTTSGTTRPTRRSNTVRTTAYFNKNMF